MCKKPVFLQFLQSLRVLCFACMCTLFSFLNVFADCEVSSVISQTPASGTAFEIVNSDPVDGVSILSSSQMVASQRTYNENEPNKVLYQSGSSQWVLIETSDVDRYNQQLRTYLKGSEWQVQFDTGILKGYGVCGASKWGSSGTKTGAITNAGYGCACTTDLVFDASSISAQKFIGLTNSGFSGTNLAKNDDCRSKCAALCATKVATDSSFRNSLLNLYETCPLVQSEEPIPTYTITYDNDIPDGESGTRCGDENYEQTYMGSITLCSPTREGYEFVGWFDYETGDFYQPNTVLQATTTTLLDDWRKIYTITYHDEDNNITPQDIDCENQQYLAGASVNLCEPHKTGYTFDFWIDQDEELYEASQSVSGKSLSLTASWSENSITYTFWCDYDDGEYLVSVRSKTTTFIEVTFRVNVETKKVIADI